MTRFISIIYLFFILAVSNRKVDAQNNVCDKQHGGFHPYPKDCGKYIACSNSQEHVMFCPSGLWFDVNKKVCEHKQFAVNPFCQVPCLHDGIEPDQSNCSRYMFCNKKKRYIMNCPKGLHFDVKSLKCEDPKIAKNPYCTGKNSSGGGGKGTHPDVKGLCKGKANGTYFYEKACTKFIICSNQIAHLMSCPKGLWYDVTQKQCEHQYKAFNPKCTESLTSNDVSSDTLPKTKRSHLTWHTSLTDFCLIKYFGHYQYKPDCGKYIRCDKGVTKMMSCAPGTYFDESKSACVHKRNAKLNCFVHVIYSDSYVDIFCQNQKAGAYNYKTFCAKYIKCDGKGHGVAVECPSHYNFYNFYGTCVWEQIYPCKDTSLSVPTTTTTPTTTTPTTTTSTSTTTTTKSKVKPPKTFCGSKNGNFPDPFRCDRYISCRTGFDPVYRPCPDGLWYNPEKNVCDWPTSSQCVRHDPLCRNVPDGDYKHPNDCSKFVICSSGRGVAISCPKGLLFNTVKTYCDYPANVQCTASNDEDENNRKRSLTDSTFEDKFCHRKKVGNYAHPTLCDKFISCNGVGYIMDCPASLWYNPKTDACDYPHNVNCNPGSTSKPLSTTAHPTTHPSHPPHTTHSATTVKPTTERPENKFCMNKKPGNYPHPTRCDKFISCNGVGYIMNCPTNLWYNPKTDACDYPHNVNCNPGSTSKPPSTTVHPTTHPTHPPHTHPTTHSSHPPNTTHPSHPPNTTHPSHPPNTTHPSHAPNTTHPSHPPHTTHSSHPPHTTHSATTNKPTTERPENKFCINKKSGNYPHPTRCDGFISCTAPGVGYFMICPANLWYNPKTDVCDYPHNVNCNPGSTSKPPSTTAHPTTHPSHPPHTTHSATTVKPTTERPENKFCMNKKPGNYPHPTRCDKFISCNGVGYIMNCPANLWYNPKTDACDYPHNVNCNPGSTSKPPSTTAHPSHPPHTHPTTHPSHPPHTTQSATTVKPTTERPENKFCMNKKSGNYPHPTRCDGFISCTAPGVGYFMNCPANLWYNTKTDACDYPHNVNCNPSIWRFSCRYKSAGAYPSPTHCNQFYVCNGKSEKPTLQKCPKHTNFFPKLKVCVWSFSYSCEDPLFCAGRGDGDYTNKNNCAGYYRCSGGQTQPRNCDIGKRFDGNSCVNAVNVVCPYA